MSIAPKPVEIFQSAAKEGRRRLDQSLLELVATSFIAGFTIVFGIVALGLVQGAFDPLPGRTAEVAGSLAFGLGLVYLVVGRAELFTENFFDPAATLFSSRHSSLLGRIGRLWSITLLLNLVGGVLLCLAVAVPGTLPEEARRALIEVANHVAERGGWPIFTSAVVGGALIALLSFLLQAVNSVGSRAALAYSVGFLLAVGPFDHVVVSVLHLVLGLFLGAPIGAGAIATVGVIDIAGNLVGGLGLVTLSHVAQAKGAEHGDD